MRWFLFTTIGLSLGTTTLVAEPPRAVELLQKLEARRLGTKPFQLNGVVSRPLASAHFWNTMFSVQSAPDKYRIQVDGKPTVCIFDGEKFLVYDGEDTEILAADQQVKSALAFSPRAIDISSGLLSFLSLEENIAYRTAQDFEVSPSNYGTKNDELVAVELTDHFSQRIRFDMETQPPFRVHRYIKTIYKTKDASSVFVQYVTENEFWPDQDDDWIPSRIKMCSLYPEHPEREVDVTTVSFSKPEYVPEFDASIWTLEGLNMPPDTPVTDLRIKKRIGYWNGQTLMP